MTEETLFIGALEVRDPAEREAYLDRVCGGDAALRGRLERLLARLDRAGDFLEAPGLDLPATRELPQVTEQPGATVGPYKLLEVIGEGGFGVVYMAEQQRPVCRKVALKVLKPGMDTRQVVARFEAERQALALMDHPNIARIHDGGTTATGRPYFVMELVRGVPITEFCDRSHLPVRDRLDVFVRVCQAVQHAHSKGVIHRDLKPSNVLVTLHDETPVPKVIDFGVAKAVGHRLTDRTLFTGLAQMVGTPVYMSPEQAELSGLDVDTRSDVYSLGVVLYELLTGTTPFDRERLQTVGYDEMRRIIREEEPPRPSSRLSTLGQAASTVSGNRRSEPRRLTALVRGELDWIVMKCLEKDRTRRYETAADLAKDMQRYLSDEPVQACPASVWYRLRKLARRNHVALVTTAVLFTGVLAVAGSIGWAVRDRAARRAEMDLERSAREVESERDRTLALDRAADLRDQGRWSEARAALSHARGLLAHGGTTDQSRRSDQIERDLDMAARLEALAVRRIFLEPPRFPNYAQTDAHSYAAFRDYGIDLNDLDSQTAVRRIRASAIREALLFGLDDWASARATVAGYNDQQARLAKNPSTPVGQPLPLTPLRADLGETADGADDDADRKQIRRIATLAFSPLTPRGADRGPAAEVAAKPDALRLGPQSAIILARALGQSDRALSLLMSAQLRYPADLPLNLELAVRLDRSKSSRRTQAIGYLRVALALRPDNLAIHHRLADMLRSAHLLDEGIVTFGALAQLTPGDNRVHAELGFLYAETGNWDEALRSFDTAIHLSPGESQARVYLGRGAVHARLGEWELAAQDFRWVRPFDLNDPDNWPRYAAVYLLGGKNEAYRELAVRVYKLGNQGPAEPTPSAKANLPPPGVAGRRQYLAARTLSLGSNCPVSPTDAVRLAKEAVAKDATAWHLHTLGMTQYRAGQFREAVQTLEAVESIPAGWEGMVCNWLALALAHHRAGDVEKGRVYFAKAVSWIETTVTKKSGQTVHPLPGLHEHDSLACYVLRREAEDLFYGSGK